MPTKGITFEVDKTLHNAENVQNGEYDGQAAPEIQKK